MEKYTRQIEQEANEDKELYENYTKEQKELGQILYEFWGFYFLTVKRSDAEWTADVPFNMKNKWIRTAQVFQKTLNKIEIEH